MNKWAEQRRTIVGVIAEEVWPAVELKLKSFLRQQGSVQAQDTVIIDLVDDIMTSNLRDSLQSWELMSSVNTVIAPDINLVLIQKKCSVNSVEI